VSLPPGWAESAYIRYQREHLVLRVTVRNLTNHELREVLVGLWLRLDEDDRLDHIRELSHYATEPGAFVSGIAEKIAAATAH